MTKTAAEAALHDFIREGWLEKSRNGFFTITERGLLELKGYITEMFTDMDEEEGGGRVDKLRTCHACQEIITKVLPTHPKKSTSPRGCVLICRANDARRYDARYGSITIVRQTTFRLGIIAVQPVRQPGKNIYQSGRQPVPIEVDEEVRITSEEAGEVNPLRRIEGLVRVLHLG